MNRHGGGGPKQTAGEPRRIEHLARYLDTVAEHLPEDADVLIIGPGTVRQHLERSLREADEHRHRRRTIRCRPAGPLTDGQLVDRLNRLVGADPIRRSVGAYR